MGKGGRKAAVGWVSVSGRAGARARGDTRETGGKGTARRKTAGRKTTGKEAAG